MITIDTNYLENFYNSFYFGELSDDGNHQAVFFVEGSSLSIDVIKNQNRFIFSVSERDESGGRCDILKGEALIEGKDLKIEQEDYQSYQEFVECCQINQVFKFHR